VKKKSTNKQLAKALFEVTKDLKGNDLKKVLNNFVVILAREHKLKKSGYIIAEYVKYAKIKEGIREIEITTARELDEKTLNHIKKAFGNNTEANVIVDESLIGGVRIKTENKILDASIKTQLVKLKSLMI